MMKNNHMIETVTKPVRSGLRCLVGSVFVVLVLFTTPIHAALIPTTFSVEATAVDTGITAVAVGDKFLISLIVDDSVIDTNASVGAGTFASLLTSYTMVPDPGNVGTWAPTGPFDLAGSNYVTNAFGDGFTFQMTATGFPDGGTLLPFADIDQSFGWPTDLTDSGLGDTFAQQLGVPFGVPPATLSFSLRFSSEGGFPLVSFLVTPLVETTVPVPALNRYSLIVLVLVLLLVGWRRTFRTASSPE